MTAADATTVEITGDIGTAARQALRAARIRGVLFAFVGLLALNAARTSFDVPATFSFWVDKQGGTPIALTTSAGVLWLLAGIAAGGTGIAQLVRGASFQWRRSLLIVIPLFIAAVLGSLLAGKAANLTGVLSGSLELAVPITLGAFAGILSERSGMLNIAIEGKFLIGACAAAIVASVTGNALIGVFAAIVAGALVGLLLAWLGIRYGVDQIIAGVVVNIGALGITNFLFLRVLSKNTFLNTPPTIEASPLPVLSGVPVLGPLLFSGTPYLYFTIALMLFLTYMLFRTRWGLRLRASGEKPSAAGTVGIDVLAHPLPGDDPRRHARRVGRLVPEPVQRRQLPDEHERRPRVHRARRRDLRRVAPHRRLRRRPRVRLLRQHPGAAVDPRRRRAATAAQQRPVHRDDHRRRGRGRAGPRAGGGRPAIHPGLTA